MKKSKEFYEKVESFAANWVGPYIRKELEFLLFNEEKHGGHAIQRHLWKSEEELTRRALQTGHAVSGFYSLEDAEKYIELILSDYYNQLDIAEWLLTSKQTDDLELFLSESALEQNVGVVCYKNKDGNIIFKVATDIKLILRKDESEKGWRLVTAYPFINQY